MSRVSSASVKEKAIKMFFDNYPTPTACLHADPSHLHKFISPLGLFETRFRSIVEVSRKFLSLSVVFNVGLTKELKIYGIGEFGVDSFQIFCRDVVGNDSNYCPGDKNLQSYCRWRKTFSWVCVCVCKIKNEHAIYYSRLIYIYLVWHIQILVCNVSYLNTSEPLNQTQYPLNPFPFENTPADRVQK